MDAQRTVSRELDAWHRGSWEADALTAFEGGCGNDILQYGLSAEDVLSLGLLGDSAPEAGTHRADVLPVATTVQLPREPQLCRSSSEQTHVGSANGLAATDQLVAPGRDSSCLLEEALTSIGMRQLLPQISMAPGSMEFSYGNMQASVLLPSSSYMPYASGAASVFVPCTNPQPLPDICKMEPAWCRDNELLSSGSMASSGTTDGCVLELRHHSSLPHITIKSEACVPDYNASSEGSPCMPPFHSTQSPILGMDGHMDGYMQPRVAFLKLDEDCFFSDSEERLTLKMPSIDHRSLLTDEAAPAFDRKECLQRYRHKKQRRHFSLKVRYTARKLNAERRPRYKGRFIKASDLSALDLE